MLDKLQLNQLIRYGYGGFLLTGIVAFFAPKQIKDAIEAGGTVVSPLVILAIGAAIYILHRYVLGELFIYPITHLFHWLFDKMFGRGRVSRPTGHLASKGVQFGRRQSAYTDVRRQLFSEDERKRLDLDHSEAHVLWITALESAGAFVYLSSLDLTLPEAPSENIYWFFLATTVAVTVSALWLDIRLHQNEYRLLTRTELNPPLDQFLRAKGYIE